MASKKQVTYTIALIPDDGAETRAFGGITKSKIIVWLALLSLLAAICASLLIVFTPIRTFIPGYAQSKSFQKSIEQNQLRLDSLQMRVQQLDGYNQKLKILLSATSDSTSKRNPNILEPAKPRTDGFTLNITDDTKRTLTSEATADLYVGRIVSGKISQDFLPAKSHYGLDIATASNEPIGALADGVVLFAGWTTEYGFALAIQSGTLVSFYKHCNRLLVREGEEIRRGQTIALTGSTGTESTAPHLHLEIWKNGVPQNPADFITN
jgi:murein DD-endopeptidase MepM/ murein hydrolase activator NlpD